LRPPLEPLPLLLLPLGGGVVVVAPVAGLAVIVGVGWVRSTLMGLKEFWDGFNTICWHVCGPVVAAEAHICAFWALIVIGIIIVMGIFMVKPDKFIKVPAA
jgi:hypothetical protein